MTTRNGQFPDEHIGERQRIARHRIACLERINQKIRIAEYGLNERLKFLFILVWLNGSMNLCFFINHVISTVIIYPTAHVNFLFFSWCAHLYIHIQNMVRSSRCVIGLT